MWSAGLLVLLTLGFVADLDAQRVRVGITVITPQKTPDDFHIFITGNDASMGNWNPGAVELRRENDSTWGGSFSFPKGFFLEYKLTRGDWRMQAIYEEGKIPGNNQLRVDGDTTLVVRPRAWSVAEIKPSGKIVGSVDYLKGLKGKGLRYGRDVIVWLPPSYATQKKRRYSVLYMHDGQNVFDPNTSFAGYDWRVDDVADSLIAAGSMEEILVVGIYNSPDRMVEYSDTPEGRAYADFVVHKLKPMIDKRYRTLPEREHTAVMGSSLGGLISFLFAWWYPDVFSRTGCVSSAFSYGANKLFKEFKNGDGFRQPVKIYMDCGGVGSEATLKPGMDRMAGLLKAKGYKEGKDFMRFYDDRAEHNERSWAARVWRPLVFLFGKE